MHGTVVVGAGISGLATAYFLQRELGPEATVRVLEAGPEIGGKVRTRLLAGLPVDTGPDAFLSRAPELRELIADLGLADSVVEPLGGGAYIWSRGRLRPLPPGMAFGLPERLLPLLRSGLLTPSATLRASLDLVLPPTRTTADPTVAELVRPRFGRASTTSWSLPCSVGCTPATPRGSAPAAPCPRWPRWPAPGAACTSPCAAGAPPPLHRHPGSGPRLRWCR